MTAAGPDPLTNLDLAQLTALAVAVLLMEGIGHGTITGNAAPRLRDALLAAAGCTYKDGADGVVEPVTPAGAQEPAS